MRSQIYLLCLVHYGLTEMLSIEVVDAGCSYVHLFTTEYEEVMVGYSFRPENKGIFYCAVIHKTHSFVTIAGLHCK